MYKKFNNRILFTNLKETRCEDTKKTALRAQSAKEKLRTFYEHGEEGVSGFRFQGWKMFKVQSSKFKVIASSFFIASSSHRLIVFHRLIVSSLHREKGRGFLPALNY